jgi:hypothetical protein
MEARVRCDGCDFAWYGADSAHGLSVIGRCPRCGSTLQFLDPVEPAQPAASDSPGGKRPAGGKPAGSGEPAKGKGGSRFKRPEPDPPEPSTGPSTEPSRILGVPRTWD